MYWFVAGVAVLSAVIGFLCGLSQSPIIATLVPLLFALLGAGAVWLAPRDGDQQLTLSQVCARLSLFGQQMLAFAPAFILGLWFGIYCKAAPFLLWPRGDDQSVVTEFEHNDPRLFVAELKLDDLMLRASIAHNDRRRIIGQLRQTSIARAALRQVLEKKIEEFLVEWERPDTKAETDAIEKLAVAADQLKEQAESKKVGAQELADLSTALRALKTAKTFQKADAVANWLAMMRDTNRAGTVNLATEEEVSAWRSAVEKAEEGLVKRSGSRNIAEQKHAVDPSRMRS